MRNVKQVLTEALELLGPTGEHWGKEAFYREDTQRYCLLGAIAQVCSGDPCMPSGDTEEGERTVRLLDNFLGKPVWSFNDGCSSFFELTQGVEKAIEKSTLVGW